MTADIASMEINLIAKRVRRCEVAMLDIAEEIEELRLVNRAIYETLIALSRRVSSSGFRGDPIDLLMLPPWHECPETGDTLPPPVDLDLERRGLAAFRLHLEQLHHDQLCEIERRQQRHKRLLETLRKRERDREVALKRTKRDPEIGS